MAAQRVTSRRRRITIVSAAILAILATVIACFALRNPGYAAAQVHSDNGGVWVINRHDHMIGRINVDAQELDARLMSDQADDLRQSGSAVFATSARAAQRVNPAAQRLEGRVDLSQGDQVEIGGDRTALLKGGRRLWILSSDQLAGFDPKATPATYTGRGGEARMTVGQDGTVYLLEGNALHIFAREDSTPTVPESDTVTIPGNAQSQQLQLSAVGAEPVVLNASEKKLYVGTSAQTVDLPGAGITDPSRAVLQKPSVGGDSVALATNDALYQVPLSGGHARKLDAAGNGEPIAPVQAAGCTYAAWNTAATYLTVCGSGAPRGGRVPEATAASKLVLRVNHELVVLNDEESGTAWLISEGMQIVKDWQVRTDLAIKNKKQKKKETLTSSVTNVAPDQRPKNRVPVAADDRFGVRAKRSIVLPVVDNDSDPDGDVLTVTPLSQPSIGQVTAVQDGTALQVDVRPGASGRATFRYAAEDGRGGRAEATVTLDVHDDRTNAGPAPVDGRVPLVHIAPDATVPFNVAPHFRDPDGDPFYLSAASVEGRDDLVTFRPDGMVTFNDAGLTTGDKHVRLTFRDAKGASSQGEMVFDVKGGAPLPPVTTPDHIQTVTGRTASIEPLLNDLNPAGGELELAFVSTSRDLQVVPDLKAGTVDVTGRRPGTYYLTYQAGSGTQTVQGLIRVDILEPTSQALAPVAVDDLALVTAGRGTLIDPLANDVDRTGGVLVVDSAQAPRGSGLTVTVLDHHLLRITADADTPAGDVPIPVDYEVANGTGAVHGTVRVMVIPPDTQFDNPVAVPDRATVRAGDVTRIPVLDNDRSPSSSALHLTSVDTKALGSKATAEIVEDQLRVEAAPSASGDVTATYETTDETGRTGSATATVHIVPRNDANDAPQPENSEARTVAGTTVRIPVRTSGIDPDGDSTLLTGITGDPPTKGRVLRGVGEFIEYQAYPDSAGTDTLTYQVMDAQGGVGTAQITIGIAKPSTTNLPPVTQPDTIRVRPSRALQMHVLDNDTDPEGETLSIDRSRTTSDPHLKLAPPVTQRRIPSLDTTSPAQPGTYAVSYGASDGQLTSPGVATVVVDKDAPLAPPVARDDYVDAKDVTDTASSAVQVDVLANDTDPDGSVEKLTPRLIDPPAGATVTSDGEVRLHKADDQQRVKYTITDQDGQTSSAFIWVPGRTAQAPQWVGDPIRAQAGKPVTIDLRDPKLVRVRAGTDGATIIEPEQTQARHDDGSELVADAHTLRYTAAADYSGSDTISVRVSDSADAGNRDAAVATLQIPVQVTSQRNLPPRVHGAQLQVPKGEDAVPIDLSRGASDPEGDRLTFTPGQYAQPAGVHVSRRDGTTLLVKADASTTVGTVLDIPVGVSDGHNPPQSAMIHVQITASQRTKPQPAPHTVTVDVGRDATVDVLATDYNPFPDTPLKILDARTVSGGVTARVAGGKIVLSARSGFHGAATVSYRLQDATGQPDRVATGTITANVRDVPAPPSAPRITRTGDGQVELTFTAGADNGAPIRSYRVSSASGPGASAACPSTSCTLRGLRNGATYTFSVTATNDVGTSKPSTASAPARPDVKPERPAAPSARRGDGQLSVTWAKPSNRGSPIERYELQMRQGRSGATQTRTFGAGTTSTTWTGLPNGVDVTFTVRAVNGAKDPSDWSPPSQPEHAAGKPLRPHGTPRATRVNTALGRAVNVSLPGLSPAEANGEPITAMVVTAFPGGKTVRVGAGEDHATFQGLDPNTAYTFTYVGVNSVGTGSAASPRSNAVQPYSVPKAPASVQASIDKASPDGKARVTWKPADSRGTRLVRYVIRWSGGGSRTVDASQQSATITGLTNGKAYTFTVQAQNGIAGGESELSAPSNAVTPYTSPQAPQVSGSPGSCQGASCTATFTASANGSGGADPVTLQYRLDGGGWTRYSGPVTATDGGSGSHTLVVRATNARGLTSPEVSAQATTPARTPKIATSDAESFGQKMNIGPQCNSQYCRRITVRISNLSPGKHTFRLGSTTPAAPNQETPFGEEKDQDIGADGTFDYARTAHAWTYGYPGIPMYVYVDGQRIGSVSLP